ncbi:hypothetical protein L2734_05870 [Parashewanella spongiae]|nr:hypothetical protein [Parashewanella spongiae]MCL1077706.1 hypothetical protein [Parashewanella spongiae]
MSIAIDKTLSLLPEGVKALEEVKKKPEAKNGTDVTFPCESTLCGIISYQVRFMNGKATQAFLKGREEPNRKFKELQAQHPLVVFINFQIELSYWDIIEKPEPELESKSKPNLKPANFASPRFGQTENAINEQL